MSESPRLTIHPGGRSALPERPKLRQDLEFRRTTNPGRVAVIDAARGVFELYEIEVRLARLADGRHTIDELVAEAAQLGLPIDRARMESFLRELRGYGFLEGVEPLMPFVGKQTQLTVVGEPEIDLLDEQPTRIDDSPPMHTASRREDSVMIALSRLDGAPGALAQIQQRLTPASVSAVRQSGDYGQWSGETTDPVPRMDLSYDGPDHTPLPAAAPPPAEPPAAAPAAQAAPPVQEEQQEEEEAPAPQVQRVLTDGSDEKEWKPSLARARWVAALTRWGIRLAVVGGLVAAMAFIPYPLYVTEKCVLVPADRAQVRAMVAGTLVEISFDEGDRVQKGDVIARIDDKDLLARKAGLRASHERLLWELEKLKHGARPEEVSQERQALASKRTALDFARQRAARTSKLFASQVASQETLDEANRDLSVKERDLAEEEARMRLLQAGARPEEIAAKEAEIRHVEADQALADTQLDRAIIKSPIAGIITTPHFREHLHEGVKLGDRICEIVDPLRMRAEIMVPERELDVVALGQPVTLKVHAYPQHPFVGEVSFISAAAETDASDGQRYVRVVAFVDNSEKLLREDMTGFGEIRAGKRSILALAARRIVRWVRVRFLI
jgi:multidrug resistance efflux pump